MKISSRKFIFKCVCLLFITGSFSACNKMDSTYKDFIKNGVKIYPGKPDSLSAHSGKGRIELSWTLSDPNVNECKVYWNQGQDSLEVPIPKGKMSDTVQVIIDNLVEGIYDFKVYSYDGDGDVSVASETLGAVYGEQYSTTLANRFAAKLMVVDGLVLVAWSLPDEGTIGEEITYLDRDGLNRNIFVPAEDTAKIANLPPGGSFNYKTLYLPDSTAIDTFFTESESITVAAKLFEVELDKTRFMAVHLPTDTYQPHGSSNTMDKIWDDILNTDSPTFLTDPGSGLPQWFTFDLGVKVKLARMKLYQRGNSEDKGNRLYNGGNVRKFEIWGSSNEPNPDGSWGGWILLMAGESIKPSGSPPGEVTQADIDYALAGEEFMFPDTIPAVRYIRFKTMENWDTKHRTYTNIGELTFWGE